MTQAQNERRLERVEEKLDKLAEAVVSIARIEERVNTVLKHHDRFFNRLDRLEARVETVENKSMMNQNAISILQFRLVGCYYFRNKYVVLFRGKKWHILK